MVFSHIDKNLKIDLDGRSSIILLESEGKGRQANCTSLKLPKGHGKEEKIIPFKLGIEVREITRKPRVPGKHT